LWTPSRANIREKFTVACTQEALRRAFLGVGHSLQAGNISDLDVDQIIETIKNKI
jgi:hypothetical protein